MIFLGFFQLPAVQAAKEAWTPPAKCVPADFSKAVGDKAAESRSGCFVSKLRGSNKHVHYHVTFPPGYQPQKNCKSKAESQYPYAIFLHGRGGHVHNEFASNDGESQLAAYASKKGNPSYLVVSPLDYPQSYWKDGPKGSMNTAKKIGQELTAHIESQKCIRKDPCLMGISMGGHGASYLKFRFPEKFKSAYAIAPIFRAKNDLEDFTGVYGGDNYEVENPLDILLKGQAGNKAKIGNSLCKGYRAEISEGDHLISKAEEKTKFRREQIELIQKSCGTCNVAFEKAESGGHDGAYFKPALKRAIEFCGKALSKKEGGEQTGSADNLGCAGSVNSVNSVNPVEIEVPYIGHVHGLVEI